VVAGTTTTFQGSGTIIGMGQVSITGTLVRVPTPSGPLSIAATFTLTNAKGSVTIQLSKFGPTASTSSSVQASFSIIKATGAFQGDVATGTADLKTIAELVPVVPPTVARGIFSLALHTIPTTL
jgi:hypothetical protein